MELHGILDETMVLTPLVDLRKADCLGLLSVSYDVDDLKNTFLLDKLLIAMDSPGVALAKAALLGRSRGTTPRAC